MKTMLQVKLGCVKDRKKLILVSSVVGWWRAALVRRVGGGHGAVRGRTSVGGSSLRGVAGVAGVAARVTSGVASRMPSRVSSGMPSWVTSRVSLRMSARRPSRVSSRMAARMSTWRVTSRVAARRTLLTVAAIGASLWSPLLGRGALGLGRTTVRSLSGSRATVRGLARASVLAWGILAVSRILAGGWRALAGVAGGKLCPGSRVGGRPALLLLRRGRGGGHGRRRGGGRGGGGHRRGSSRGGGGGAGRGHVRHGLVLGLLLVLVLVILLVGVLLPGRGGARTVRTVIHLLHGLQHLAGVHWVRGARGRGRGHGPGPGALRSLGAQLLHLLLHHLLVILLVHGDHAVLPDLHLELVRALLELPLLALVLLLDGGQLRLELLLVHGEALDLSPQHLHPRRGHHAPHVRHHRLPEDLVDESVVPHVARVRHVFHAQPVIRILLVLGGLQQRSPSRPHQVSPQAKLPHSPECRSSAP